ncbi:hypothetical protein [Clostridium algidicarnis]|uniref:hypothetical protein n=1 Tax=Clostridium algidicarnis TaxID=37659 RepID=UPI001C0D9219|nr:hypothetical protein [Clostridium algidicarnis]MBU3227311.1 hypothetical protein [Clostridium algidicarnis]MBU3250834.1 hypothetical protein [Clostridium algidicarnis]
MKDFKILKILDKFQWLYKKLSVNYDTMRMILQIKLIMDSRRVSVIMSNNNKGEDDCKNNYIQSLMINMFMSIFTGLIIMYNVPSMVAANIIIGISLFMMVSIMISDFSSVLLDVREKNILLPKPIDNKTFNAAKTTHICIYLMGLSLSLTLIPLIMGTVKYGALFFVIFLVENILSVLIVISLTSLIYTLVLRFFDGEKLKDIINYFQIILAFVLIFGYQLAGRVFSGVNMKGQYVPKFWHALLPSMWFASTFGILIDGNKETFLIFLSSLAIIVPITLMVIYIKKLVPYFEKNLQKLNDNGGAIRKVSGKRKDLIVSLVCNDNIEKSMFKFTQNMISTERDLKLKIYPSLATALFIPILFMLIDRNDGNSFMDNIQISYGGKVHLLMYISIILLCFCTAYINNSDSYKGAFIYKVLPIESPGIILKGAIKGALFKLVIPLYILESVLFLILKGPAIILDLIVMFLVLLIISVIYFKISNDRMPFSVKFTTTDSSKLLVPTIICILVLAVFALIHIAIRNNITLLGIYAVVLLIVNIILWKTSFKVSWKDIKM